MKSNNRNSAYAWLSFRLAAILFLGTSLVSLSGAEDQQPDLATREKALAEQFDRLELLAGRLAELSQSTQPRRAELLRQLVSRSHTNEVPNQFENIVESLKAQKLGDALKDQETLQKDLQAMLELLLQEDRDSQIESERKRIAQYIAELNKVIRQERGIRARTFGEDEMQQLAEDQQRTTETTDDLKSRIDKTEGVSEKSSSSERNSDPSQADPSQGEPTKGDSPSKESAENQSKSPAGQGEQSSGKPSEGEPSQGESGESGEGKPSEGQSGQSNGSSGQGDPSSSGDGESSPQEQTPAEKAVERLRRAQQRMQQAESRLKEAKRKDAVEEQDAALRELEQAKAELEKILRQLREEEMERMLVLLEARFRKMLEAQNFVYEETVSLEKSRPNVPEHEVEIASATLSRKEDQIVDEADRALVLLREDGTSVAFPEALTQAREDMQTVSERLRTVKTGEITQALEEDIIQTLEEILAALQQALQELRDQKASQQQSGGEPGEQPLVDQLAELRMIRALQNRVNRRTQFYDRLIEGDRTFDNELLEALDKLSERQEQIFKATRDLHQGTNR